MSWETARFPKMPMPCPSPGRPRGFWYLPGRNRGNWRKLRIYVGAIGNNYQVRAYLGGRLDETGTLREPEGVQTALIEENARAVNQWVEIYFSSRHDGRQP